MSKSDTNQNQTTRVVLMLSCPDQSGIVATVAKFIHTHNGNIVDSIQHNAVDNGNFYMRVEWDYWHAVPNKADEEHARAGAIYQQLKQDITKQFTPIAHTFDMQFQIWIDAEMPKIALFVSRQLHCLYDLMLQWHEKQLPHCDIACVISNHQDAAEMCNWLGVPFYHTPLTLDTKHTVEKQQIAILQKHQINLIILARYMQILSKDFVNTFPNQIINIHHSFLPAFVGAKPYHQAYARGVKIIGATSHYATHDLDQGPIIEQDVVRISHRDTIIDIIQKGKNLERTVLLQAVTLHIQRRVFVYGNKTIVFQ